MIFIVTDEVLPTLLVNIAWADKYETKLHGCDSMMIIERSLKYFGIKCTAGKPPTKSEIVQWLELPLVAWQTGVQFPVSEHFISCANGLVVKSIVAIDGPPVRFRVCAYFFDSLLFFFTCLDGTRSSKSKLSRPRSSLLFLIHIKKHTHGLLL